MVFALTTVLSTFLASATLATAVRNPIHSLLFLILVFFTGSLLFIYLRVEFFALMFLIVYVGAIVVLFLFIVMMLQIKIISNEEQNNFNLTYIIGPFMILAFLIINYTFDFSSNNIIINLLDSTYTQEFKNFSQILINSSHVQTIGKSLFETYIFPFLIIGFILFIAMVGAIVITIENPSEHLVKQQNPINQTLKSTLSALRSYRMIDNVRL